MILTYIHNSPHCNLNILKGCKGLTRDYKFRTYHVSLFCDKYIHI